MATFTDISTIAGYLQAQAVGSAAISQVDRSATYSLGDTLSSLASADNDIIFGALIDRIGKTVVANRLYKNQFDWLSMDDFEYGYILQNIDVELFTARANGKYYNGSSPDTDLYSEFTPTIHVTLFKNSIAWEFAMTITREQVKTAFTSPEALAAFINGIYVAMDESMTKSLENFARSTLASYMGEKLAAQAAADAAVPPVPTVQAINLIKEYYDETGSTVTTSTAWYTADFLRWCTSKFLEIKGLMANMTVLFNGYQRDKFTQGDYFRFIINSKFADAIKRFMTSNVYHDELIETPGVYREVDYWQGVGTTGSLQDRTTINAKLVSGAESGGVFVNNTVNKAWIIGAMFDRYAIGMTIYDRETVAVPNPHRHRTNVFEQAAVGNFINLAENGVVFYLEDYTPPEDDGGDGGEE